MLTTGRDLTAVVLGLLITGTVTALVAMLRQHARGRLVIDQRQVLLRAVGSLLMIVLWCLVGLLLLGVDPRERPKLFLLCFYLTLLLACGLPFVALLDLRLLSLNKLRAEMRLTEEYIRACAPTVPRHES
ncbi:MAG: hypothetical protein IT204_15870 [Fimbriimonadaceae bacterium]|nr:hypothetical protein [Fimbriimonadaceae bacterium]